MKISKWLVMFLLCLSPQFTQAVEVVVEVSDGYEVLMDMEPEESLISIQEQIELELNLPVEQQTLIVKCYDFSFDGGMWYDQSYEIADAKSRVSRMPTSNPRNYQAKVTSSEKKDITYIVNSLANKSLASLLTMKPSLQAAGVRINNIHPLRFLMCVFTDEELKVGIRNIHKRGGWVWSEFEGDLIASLDEEAKRGNVRDDFINDFAKTVGIDSNVIFPTIRNKKWHDFIVTLIKKVPRKGGSDRYDM